MAVCGLLFMYTSAHFWARITMVSEPLTVIRSGAGEKANPAKVMIKAMSVNFFMIYVF